jgi:hypothetical protein
MKIFAGSGLHRAIEALVDAPVLLDSDANASLLGILTNDATITNAALFSVSTILNFASCTDHELARGSTPTFGDIGVLSSGAGDEILDELLSTRGLLRFARKRGLDLERVEALWAAICGSPHPVPLPSAPPRLPRFDSATRRFRGPHARGLCWDLEDEVRPHVHVRGTAAELIHSTLFEIVARCSA